MQAALQFFDMPLKGLGLDGTQKIAIKMPGQTSEKSVADDGGFMEIMDALMALSPEQLQASLKQLEWVPVEGGNQLFAPVIDMSDLDSGSQGLFQMLAEQLPQSTPSLPLGPETAPMQHFAGLQTEKPIMLDHAVAKLSSTEISPQIQTAVSKPEFIDDGLVGNKTSEEIPRIIDPVQWRGKKEGFKVWADPAVGRGVTVDSVVAETQKGTGDLTKAMDAVKVLHTAKVPDTAAGSESGKALDMSKVSETVKPADIVKAFDAINVDERGSESHQPKAERTTEGHTKSGLPWRSDFQKNLAAVDGQTQSEAVGRKPNADAKPLQAVEAEKFKVVNDAMPNSNDKIFNAAHQIKEAPIKEIGRQNVQPVVTQADLDKVTEKTTKVQPNSSARDAALSFSSRWAAMADNNPEATGDAKASSATPEKTDANDLIRQIVQRMTLKTGRLQSQMNIKLKPEFLGNVRLQIITDHQQVAVRMVAESSAVKEVLEQNIQYLKAELQQHGLEIDKFDVLVGKDNDENRQGQNALWQRRSPQKERSVKGEDPGKTSAKDKESTDQQLEVSPSVGESEIDYFA